MARGQSHPGTGRERHTGIPGQTPGERLAQARDQGARTQDQPRTFAHRPARPGPDCDPCLMATTGMSAPLSSEDTPPLIPGYTLLRRIGQRSYGEVWLARQSDQQLVAVKVVYQKSFDHDRPFERELSGIRKFEPISRTHPSQVNILAVGVDQPGGYFYYVMELADDAN